MDQNWAKWNIIFDSILSLLPKNLHNLLIRGQICLYTNLLSLQNGSKINNIFSNKFDAFWLNRCDEWWNEQTCKTIHFDPSVTHVEKSRVYLFMTGSCSIDFLKSQWDTWISNLEHSNFLNDMYYRYCYIPIYVYIVLISNPSPLFYSCCWYTNVSHMSPFSSEHHKCSVTILFLLFEISQKISEDFADRLYVCGVSFLLQSTK